MSNFDPFSPNNTARSVDPFAPNNTTPSIDPFAPNNATSPGQPATYQSQSQGQAHYVSPMPSPTRGQNPSQLIVEYQIPGQTQNQVQPHFQLGEQDVSHLQQQSQQPNNVAKDRRSKSLSGDPLEGRRKYHSARSVDSSASSRSGYSAGQSPLDDPTFAPPPDKPTDASYIARGRNSHTRMPSFDMVKHSGNAMARISLKTLVMKKWKPIFWICYGDSRVVIFRSKNDFMEWATNPNLADIDREALVKLDVDFKNLTAKPGVRGYRAASLHLKDYGGKTGLMHTFKLEEWMYYGPIILGAFASKSRTDAHTFLIVLREIMKKHKQNLSGYGTPTSSVASSQYNSDASHRSSKSAPQRSGRRTGSRNGNSVNSGQQNSGGRSPGMFGY